MLEKVIHGVEGDANKFNMAPWKSKQHYLEVLKYIKGGEYPNAEVGKYLYDVIKGKSRKVRQYVSSTLSD